MNLNDIEISYENDGSGWFVRVQYGMFVSEILSVADFESFVQKVNGIVSAHNRALRVTSVTKEPA